MSEPEAARPRPTPELLAGALRAVAGGPGHRGPPAGAAPPARWTATQILLLGALIGLAVGIIAAVIGLLWL